MKYRGRIKEKKGNIYARGFKDINCPCFCLLFKEYIENLDKNALGIWWMDSFENLGEAIPPAYSKYIMNQYLRNYVNLDYFVEMYDKNIRKIPVSHPNNKKIDKNEVSE